jgi:dolichyl-phosphate beta-glucosyltransferase
MQKTCIVIPCYNEASRLQASTFLNFADSHPDIYFFLVNDGSTDTTRDLLVQMRRLNDRQFNFLSRDENRGKGASVREGILESLNWQQFEFVGYFDADLATPLIEIDWLLHHLMVEPLPRMAFGSRKKTEDNIIERNTLRHILGRLYAAFVTSSLGLKVHDTQCGAKIFRASLARKVFQQPFIDRWLFDLEVFCRMKKLKDGNSVLFKEVVLRQWTEMGDSRIRIIDFLSLPVKTAKIFLKYL